VEAGVGPFGRVFAHGDLGAVEDRVAEPGQPGEGGLFDVGFSEPGQEGSGGGRTIRGTSRVEMYR
jgi:hypothetical protein